MLFFFFSGPRNLGIKNAPKSDNNCPNTWPVKRKVTFLSILLLINFLNPKMLISLKKGVLLVSSLQRDDNLLLHQQAFYALYHELFQ